MSIILRKKIHAPHLQPKDPSPNKIGLGDVVAAIAKPVAIAIDAVAGTNLKNCGGCAKRQAALNAAVPNVNPFSNGKNVDSSNK